MYDQDKLNAYWKRREEIWARWRLNGWKGLGTDFTRSLIHSCGHEVYAGWGITDKEIQENVCWECSSLAKANATNVGETP